MQEKIHWRKTAKICPQCNKLTSIKRFIGESSLCVNCAYDELLFKEFKQCPYCKNFFNKKEIVRSVCEDCKKVYRERHKKFKNRPRLNKFECYKCALCKNSKGCRSYPRGSDLNNLICKLCISNQKIIEEKKFRCRGCGSIFPAEEIHWNKYCKRCYEKNKQWNKLKLKDLRKDPAWAEYFREMSRYRYYHIFKPIYNKILSIQIAHGLARKRRVNRNGFWYSLNHALFEGFKKQFHYWDALTREVINSMKNRNADYKMKEISRRPGQGLSTRERKDLGLTNEEEW